MQDPMLQTTNIVHIGNTTFIAAIVNTMLSQTRLHYSKDTCSNISINVHIKKFANTVKAYSQQHNYATESVHSAYPWEFPFVWHGNNITTLQVVPAGVSLEVCTGHTSNLLQNYVEIRHK